MINLPMKTSEPLTKQTLQSINQLRVQGPRSSSDISSINAGIPGSSASPRQVVPNPVIPQPSVQQPSAPHPSVPQPSVPHPSVPQPSAPHPSVPQPSVPQSSVQQPSVQQPSVRQQTPSRPAMPNPVGSRPTATQSYQSQSTAVSSVQTASQTVSQPQGIPSNKPVPRLINTVRKGQKIPLETNSKLTRIKVALGWNTINPACDVDVSAFLLNASGKVIGDDWFVFYGQPKSPDSSTTFSMDDTEDREIIWIDFHKLNPSVAKIVFVLTINEALEKKLNFSMLKEAYIRIIDQPSNREITSFQMDEYYANVTSMMIGEIYLHSGTWKFNAIGNGVSRDLAGLCELYGVQVE